MKHDDRLDAWLTALRHEMAQACMARACELPEKVAFDRMLDERRKRGKMDGNWMMGGTGQDVFRWWMEEDVLPGQISVDDILEN